MKSLFTLLAFASVIPCLSQVYFVPPKPEHISQADYRNGELILKNAYQQLAEDSFNILAHDYWNFATAYFKMGQSRESIFDFLYKARLTNKNDFCAIANKYHQKSGIDSTGFYKLLGQSYRELVVDCESIGNTEESVNINQYILYYGLDNNLIVRLNALLINDQKFRKDGRMTEQEELDQSTILEAEDIIKKYGYPGRTIAGPKFDFVVWIVIQHAALHYQEKYLDLIVKAVQENELNKTTLRMLLDRIYHKKTGQQIFGSQIGVPFAPNETIALVKQKYQL